MNVVLGEQIWFLGQFCVEAYGGHGGLISCSQQNSKMVLRIPSAGCTGLLPSHSLECESDPSEGDKTSCPWLGYSLIDLLNKEEDHLGWASPNQQLSQEELGLAERESPAGFEGAGSPWACQTRPWPWLTPGFQEPSLIYPSSSPPCLLQGLVSTQQILRKCSQSGCALAHVWSRGHYRNVFEDPDHSASFQSDNPNGPAQTQGLQAARPEAVMSPWIRPQHLANHLSSPVLFGGLDRTISFFHSRGCTCMAWATRGPIFCWQSLLSYPRSPSCPVSWSPVGIQDICSQCPGPLHTPSVW